MPPPSSIGAAPALRRLLLLGVLFHVLYALSIFDIFFKSPVVSHVESLAYTTSAPAKRVIVFVGDGCRADKFFMQDIAPTPFLRGVMEHNGSWGVSHTRVPTESRPGHVAIFAGMYEDVSAVTKGWQDNPVDFDSVFNQSRHAWLFGSPDIVPMFARRVPHATEKHYAHTVEDFAANDASETDVWVYNELRKLLTEDAAKDAALDGQLRDENVVFFCHFLGLDTNGHAFRPHSQAYLDNIMLVDSLIEKTYAMVEDFYGHDGRTAYVFTADHGMSNKGAHGDGEPANTRTPLVVWGAGVDGPTRNAAFKEGSEVSRFHIDVPTQSQAQVHAQLQAQQVQEDAAMQEWGLTHLVRKDIMQADLAALVSALVGIPYPRNSVGVLPYAFLKPGEYRAHAVRSNAQQLMLHASRKAQDREAQTLLFFRPYAPFREHAPELEEQLEAAWARGELEKVEHTSQELVQLCLDTLSYFQRYDWAFLLSVIVAGYFAWIGVVGIAFAAPSFAMRDLLQCFDARLGAIAVATFVFLALEHSPITYYLYIACPLLFGNFVWFHRTWLASWAPSGHWFGIFSIAVSLELVVIGYHIRWVFGIVFSLVALWPIVDRSVRGRSSYAWTCACLILSVFAYLPTEYGDQTLLVQLGGLAVLGLSLIVLPRSSMASLLPWALPILASLGSLHLTMNILTSKQKPPAWLSTLNWLLAVVPIVALALQILRSHHATAPRRSLVQIALAFTPLYVLLSISYEVLFFAALLAVLVAWMQLERRQMNQDIRVVAVRRAFVLLLLVTMGFFGTGNIASISSFELSSTYRFVTVFSPFLMTALLIIKILVPLLLVACAFQLIVHEDSPAEVSSSKFGTVSVSESHYVVLVNALSDILALHFLFLVRNEGSWKEIGNSISMFAIVNALIVFIPLLFMLARVFVRDDRTHKQS